MNSIAIDQNLKRLNALDITILDKIKTNPFLSEQIQRVIGGLTEYIFHLFNKTNRS